MGFLACAGIKLCIGQGNGSSGKGRPAGVLRGIVVEQGRQAFTHYVLKASYLKCLREYLLRAQLKEQRTDLRLHARLDNGKDCRPAAAIALPPDGCHGPTTRLQNTVHLPQRQHRIGDIHQSKGAQRHVETTIWQL
jgi:hypothetical protein